jgi:hypothetical protein
MRRCRRLSDGTYVDKPLDPYGPRVGRSAALPVTLPGGRGADIAEPDIALDKLPRPQLGLAEAAAA